MRLRLLGVTISSGWNPNRFLDGRIDDGVQFQKVERQQLTELREVVHEVSLSSFTDCSRATWFGDTDDAKIFCRPKREALRCAANPRRSAGPSRLLVQHHLHALATAG